MLTSCFTMTERQLDTAIREWCAKEGLRLQDIHPIVLREKKCGEHGDQTTIVADIQIKVGS